MKDYKPASVEQGISYELAFDDGRNNGFGFPCDEQGNLLPGLTPEAIANYEFCMAHPERFERFNKVISRKWHYRQNATGICRCGNKIELYDQYMGACQCPHCGQWYNLFGQRLKPPAQWNDA